MSLMEAMQVSWRATASRASSSGPGSIDRAHAAIEYVECDQVAKATEFYRDFLLRFE